jgi:hypothetical protein
MQADELTFRGRHAVRLSNGTLELTALLGGGHMAELKLVGSTVNPLWQPHWPTIEPQAYDPLRYPEYGTAEGRLLASIAGHVLCLNHYGELSDAELAAQGYEHGEAANLPWQLIDLGTDAAAAWLTYGLELPEAGMRFARTLKLRSGEPIVHFEEEIENLRRSDSPLAYQQHVTLGAPFVQPSVTRLDLSGTRGCTFPRSYGPVDPLKPNRVFTWPNAPGMDSLDRFPSRPDLCTVCTVAMEPDDGVGFVAVSNPHLGLLLGYVFPSATFSWTALWYENGGSDGLPYEGKELAWGIEFGTCALPVSRMEAVLGGPLLGRNRLGILPARSVLRTSYEAVLVETPSDWQGVSRMTRHNDEILITERESGREILGGAR